MPSGALLLVAGGASARNLQRATCTRIVLDVLRWPAASYAFALRVCRPMLTVAPSQMKLKGGAASRAMTKPSTANLTAMTPTSSVAGISKGTKVDTELLLAGALMFTTGAFRPFPGAIFHATHLIESRCWRFKIGEALRESCYSTRGARPFTRQVHRPANHAPPTGCRLCSSNSRKRQLLGGNAELLQPVTERTAANAQQTCRACQIVSGTIKRLE